MGSLPLGMTGEGATVGTDVQMSVEPTIRPDVSGHVPPAAPEVADEHLPARRSAESRREAAGDHGPLVAMNHLCPGEMANQPRMEGVESLTADSPGRTEDPDVEPIDLSPVRSVAERDQTSRRF